MYLNVTTSTIHLLASLILIWTVKYKEKTHNIKRILSDSIYLAIHPSIYLHSAPRFCDSDLAVLRAISVVREVFTEEAQLGALGAQTLAGDNCVNSWKNTSHVRLTGSRVGLKWWENRLNCDWKKDLHDCEPVKLPEKLLLCEFSEERIKMPWAFSLNLKKFKKSTW